jgi:prepilin-type processing-associated H-X9-DG protein
MGLGIMMYSQDYDETMPPAYYYNITGGGNLDASGIHHWSGFVQPYIKNAQIFVCPSDKIGGQTPTNAGAPGVFDEQAPRISYTANEQVMPRPRGGVGGVPVGQPQHVVSLAAIDAPASVIALTEFTDYLNALSGTGPGGTFYKSHRPSDALARNAEGTAPYDTSVDAGSAPIYALSADAAKAIFAAQPNAPFGGGSYPHLIYVNSGRHSEGNTFTFCDGHSKWMRVTQTLDCNHFVWGSRAFNQGGQEILCPTTGFPVQ